MISFEAALSSSSSSCEASNLTFASALKIFSSKKTVSRNVRVAGRFYDIRLACSCPQRASFNDVTILPATTNSYREHKIRYYLMNLFVGQSRPLFGFFFVCFTLASISTIKIEESIVDVLGIRTWGCMIVGGDTEPWRPPYLEILYYNPHSHPNTLRFFIR